MLCEWMIFAEVNELTIHTAPWECELNQLLGKVCEKWTMLDTNHFNPFNWAKLLDALLKVKSKYSLIPDGNIVLQIEEYGTVEFFGDSCVESEKEPHLIWNHLDAVRFLLGSLPASSVCGAVAGNSKTETLSKENRLYVQSVFPLPLWWCNQDSV